MARRNNMVAAILISLLQVMIVFCQALESNVTGSAPLTNENQNNATANALNRSNDNITGSNLSVSNTNQSNISDTNQGSINVNEINDSNSNLTNTSQGNDSVSNMENNTISETLVADSSISEEVILTGTPVMRECVNGTSDTSACVARMLNLTLECANETGATQDDVDIAMRMEIPSSATGKCLTKCLLKHRGVMSPEGLYSPTGTVEYLIEVHKNDSLPAEFQKMADYCLGKLKLQPMSSLDTCQFAYDIALCTEEYHRTLFLRNPAMAPPVNAITTP